MMGVIFTCKVVDRESGGVSFSSHFYVLIPNLYREDRGL